jgi:DNA-binding CsgD family transcriptional regulator
VPALPRLAHFIRSPRPFVEAGLGGSKVKIIRRSQSLPSLVAAEPSQVHQTFLFYEKQSGVAHFEVAADGDGRLPVEQAACLLAMHCMVRGQSPEDYVVMVEAEQGHTTGLLERAQSLLLAGQAVKSEVKVTRREEEVLRGILRGHANKEIASDLNLSERTVKFHVSSLLSKFRVRGRMELVREASRFSNWAQSKPTMPAAREHEPREFRTVPSRVQRVSAVTSQSPVYSVAKLGLTN